jgi:hypothetical protein
MLELEESSNVKKFMFLKVWIKKSFDLKKMNLKMFELEKN